MATDRKGDQTNPETDELYRVRLINSLMRCLQIAYGMVESIDVLQLEAEIKSHEKKPVYLTSHVAKRLNIYMTKTNQCTLSCNKYIVVDLMQFNILIVCFSHNPKYLNNSQFKYYID